MTDEIRLVYVTAPSHDQALEIARIVVGERLAACANVLGAITSVYWWEGQLHEDPEVAMVLKTRAALVAALTVRINELHPYQCPCVVALPVDGGNPAFLDWIATETAVLAG